MSGFELWVAGGYYQTGRCIVDITEMSESALRGSATCRGLRWFDGLSGSGLAEPAYIDGQEPFDAELTFDARP